MVEQFPGIPATSAIMTLPNAPNWDAEAPSSLVGDRLAYCANSSVHVLRLTDEGFVLEQTVGFTAKFKKQFCRCVTVQLLQQPFESILVSLDKRTVVWEPLGGQKAGFEERKNVCKSVSVGDIVVRFGLLLAESQNQVMQTVIALTQKGHVYRIRLSQQRGIQLEQILANEELERVEASQIKTSSDGSFQIAYGTDNGQLKLLESTNGQSVTKKTTYRASDPVKTSSILVTQEAFTATFKNGAFFLTNLSEKRSAAKLELFIPSSVAASDQSVASNDDLKSKKTAPKNLTSFRLIQLSEHWIALSGNDGAIFTFANDLSKLQSQQAFENALRLVSDSGHKMPILQLLHSFDQQSEQNTLVSLSYDRQIVAWSVQMHLSSIFVDQVASITTLAQTIDPNMLCLASSGEINASESELIIIQNRPSSQKVLQLEQDGQGGVIRTTDLTCARVLDRSAPITSVDADDSCIVLVFDQARITIYDYLQKEIIHKWKLTQVYPSKGTQPSKPAVKILDLKLLPSQQKVVMLVAETQIEHNGLITGSLWELCSQTGKLTKHGLEAFQVQSDKGTIQGRLWKVIDSIAFVSIKAGDLAKSVFVSMNEQTSYEVRQSFASFEIMTVYEKEDMALCLLYNAELRTIKSFDALSAQEKLSKKLDFDLEPKLVCPVASLDQIFIVPHSAPTELLIFNVITLQAVKRLSISELLKNSNKAGQLPIFAAKPTAMLVSSDQLVLASEDKCLRLVPTSLIEQCQQLSLSSSTRKVTSKQSNSDLKKPKSDSTQLLKGTNQTLFSIIRSRVFYQQKTAETQRVVQEMTQNPETPTEEFIDLKLLVFWSGDGMAERNRREAIEVVEAELATCMFVERFEFFQKLVMLNLWLSAFTESQDERYSIAKVRDLVNMHIPNLLAQNNKESGSEEAGKLLKQYTQQLEQVLSIYDDSARIPADGQELSFLHLRQVARILSDKSDHRIEAEYLESGCFVEAMILSKFQNDKTKFCSVLESFLPKLQSENKVQQIAKVSKAIQLITNTETV